MSENVNPIIVNMQYIDKISSYVLRLTNGKEISVPKSRYAEVKRSYAAFKEKMEEMEQEDGGEK